VHNTLLGGWFGRKSKCNYAIEAALLAKEGQQGCCVAPRRSAPNFMLNFMPDPKHPLAIEPGLGLVDAPFDIPNLRIESGEERKPIPGSAGSARSTTSRMRSASSMPS
jgi:isoquinoline 1-oxidoreductase beta subunit